jgi:ABC-type Fe3+ transport system substrate-binding protein
MVKRLVAITIVHLHIGGRFKLQRSAAPDWKLAPDVTGKPFVVQATVEPLRAQRLPIERVFPADGPGVRTGGFGSVQKIKDGPHPSASALFMNWFASREAQALYEREALEMSLRTDTPHQVPDYVMPRPGIAYPVNDYDPDYFFNERVPAIARLQELLGR